jgi:uncharacterized membrane protein YqjE
VIEARDERIDDAFQICEVDQPAGASVDRTAHRDLSAERMPMHPPALVSLGHIRQIMSSLESEVLDQLDDVWIHSDRGLHFAALKDIMAMATDTDRSIGTIVKGLMENMSTLFRSEIALLKWELKDTATKLGTGAGMFAGAAFVALFGLAFLFVTILLVLVRLGVPAWLSALIVTVVLFAVAGVLAILGRKKFAATEFVPRQSVDQIKSDIETIKSDIARVRSH